MVILKKQILKHLSKFTKNLSPDKINLSTLKGEGDMNNLELDEAILMEVLDLPTWLQVTRAFCNHLSIKVQWTKLKSQPIWLLLDEVVVEVEACDEPRPLADPGQQAAYRSASKYGFAEKVIDGMAVHINSVSVCFRSKSFLASLQLASVKIQSVSPSWQLCDNLQMTRLKDLDRGEILLFKEISWQTTRIEANGILDDSSILTQPLRLIANQSKIRIAIKKKLHDCSVVSSRVIFLLDDLLWILTDTQLQAAILYVNSLKDIIAKSTEQSKQLAAEKLKRQGHIGRSEEQIHQPYQQEPTNTSAPYKMFKHFDVVTTSYHLITSRIDLHLCDDTTPGMTSKHKRDIEGGAMQVTLQKLSLDYYPYHLAGGERKLWYRYTDNLGSRNAWVQNLFTAFRDQVHTVQGKRTSDIASNKGSTHSSLSAHGGLEVSSSMEQLLSSSETQDSGFGTKDFGGSNPTDIRQGQQYVYTGGGGGAGGGSRRPPSSSYSSQYQSNPQYTQQSQHPHHHHHHQPHQHQSQQPRQPKTKLLETCLVLKVEEFIVYQVSTAKSKKCSLKKFLSSNKKRLRLPADMSVIHLEHTNYFHTDGIDFPVPHANIYCLINPVLLTVDYTTVLWANIFLLNIANALDFKESEELTEHKDVKIEVVMPTVVLSSEGRVAGQHERPHSIQLQVSTIAATNTNVEERTSLSNLQRTLHQYKSCSLFSTEKNFPNEESQILSIPPNFAERASGSDNPYLNISTKTLLEEKLISTSGSISAMVNGSVSDVSQASHKPLLHSRPDKPLKHLTLQTHTLKLSASCDIWCINMEQVWLDFAGVSSSKRRPVPFVESFPVTLWLCNPIAMYKSSSRVDQALSLTSSTGAQRSTVTADCNHTDAAVPSSQKHADDSRQYDSVRYHRDRDDLNDDVDVGFDVVNFDMVTYSPTHKQAAVTSQQRHKRMQRLMSNSSSSFDSDTYAEPIHDHEPLNSSEAEQCDTPDAPAPAAVDFSKLADLYILGKVHNKIRIQLNHFQYLFLLRLVDSYTDFKNQLSSDTEYLNPLEKGAETDTSACPNILGAIDKPSETDSKRICIPLILDDVELALMCPAIPQPSVTPSSPTYSSPLTLVPPHLSDVGYGPMGLHLRDVAKPNGMPMYDDPEEQLSHEIDVLTAQHRENMALYKAGIRPRSGSSGSYSLHRDTQHSDRVSAHAMNGHISSTREHSVKYPTHPQQYLDDIRLNHAQGHHDDRVPTRTQGHHDETIPPGFLSRTQSHRDDNISERLPYRGQSHRDDTVSLQAQNHIDDVNTSIYAQGFLRDRSRTQPQQRLSVSPGRDRDSSGERERGVSIREPAGSFRPPLRKVPSTAAEVKKTLTNAFTVFSDKLKPKSDGSDDSSSVHSQDIDNISVKTDASSEEDFEIMEFSDLAEAPAFDNRVERHQLEDELSSGTPDEMLDEPHSVILTTELLMAEKVKEQISVVIVRIEKTELMVHGLGSDVNVMSQASHVSFRETGNLPREEFLHHFCSHGGYFSENTDLSSVTDPRIKLLYRKGPLAEAVSPKASQLGHLDIRCHNLDLRFLMSSLTHIVDLIEDEVISVAIPLRIHLSDISLYLTEDLPPTNFTSPGSVPLDIHIDGALLIRSHDGVFHITSESKQKRPSTSKPVPVVDIRPTDQEVPIDSEVSRETLHISPQAHSESDISSITRTETPYNDTSNMAAHLHDRLQEMKLENSTLTALNESLADEVEQLARQTKNTALDNQDLRKENRALQDQMRKLSDMQSANLQADNMAFLQQQRILEHTQKDNVQLLERISLLEDDLTISRKEQDSLISTLKLLQDELLSSEHQRGRPSHHNRVVHPVTRH